MSHISGMIRAMSAVPRVHLADPQANVREIVELLRQADAQNVRLCVFPELCLCGYTCADLLIHPPLLSGCLQALDTLLQAPVRAAFVVGLPLEIGGRLYNCAVAVCGGRILGVVPKTHLPGSCEFYEKRWFEPGHSAPESMTLCGQTVPVGGDLVFDCGLFSFGVELCEDLWVPAPPSAKLCMGGALMIVNPSASNELVTKHRYRCELIGQQRRAMPVPATSMRARAMANRPPISCSPAMRASMKTGACSRRMSVLPGKAPSPSPTWTSSGCASSAARAAPSPRTRRKPCASSALSRKLLPTTACSRRFASALHPLRRRTRRAHGRNPDDSVHRPAHPHGTGAYAKSRARRQRRTGFHAHPAGRRLRVPPRGLSMEGLVGITMPGMGTGSRTLQNALKLMQLIGCTTKTIPIGKAVAQHFDDIGQDPEKHDIAYENSQARERTQIIMDVANQIGGLALGTGDLSELALGWCTYNGDQMSMYNMSASVPKTLIQHLVRYAGGRLGGEVVPSSKIFWIRRSPPNSSPPKRGN